MTGGEYLPDSLKGNAIHMLTLELPLASLCSQNPTSGRLTCRLSAKTFYCLNTLVRLVVSAGPPISPLQTVPLTNQFSELLWPYSSHTSAMYAAIFQAILC